MRRPARVVCDKRVAMQIIFDLCHAQTTLAPGQRQPSPALSWSSKTAMDDTMENLKYHYLNKKIIEVK